MVRLQSQRMAVRSIKVNRTFEQSIKFIYAGIINQTRQLDKLIEIVSVAKAKTAVKFSLDVFGTGDYVTKLINLVETKGLKDTIYFKGLVSQNDLFQRMPYYHAGIAYIFDKHYQFAPALKTIEYMVCGLYVLGSDTEGNKQFIRHDGHGKLSPNNVECFSKMITDYVESPIQPKSSLDVIEKHSWSHIVRHNLIPKYHEILGRE